MAPLPERPVITGRAGLMRRQIRGRWRRRVVGAAEEVIVENFIRSPKQALSLWLPYLKESPRDR